MTHFRGPDQMAFRGDPGSPMQPIQTIGFWRSSEPQLGRPLAAPHDSSSGTGERRIQAIRGRTQGRDREDAFAPVPAKNP